MTIDKEGYKIILNALIICVSVTAITAIFLSKLLVIVVGSIMLLLWLFILRFFRLPNRKISQTKGAVYSPADGTVVVSEKVFEDEILKRECVQISIFMSVWNVHANWYPVGGKINYFRHHNGDFMFAWHPKSSTENERTTVCITQNDGEEIMFRQIAGILAKRIVSYAVEGESVEQNSRCGFIKFGSRLDVFLPLDAEIKVKLGDKVIGSQTVIASLNSRS